MLKKLLLAGAVMISGAAFSGGQAEAHGPYGPSIRHGAAFGVPHMGSYRHRGYRQSYSRHHSRFGVQPRYRSNFGRSPFYGPRSSFYGPRSSIGIGVGGFGSPFYGPSFGNPYYGRGSGFSLRIGR